ncbi:MAG: hypothetical protein WAW41_10815, partial [Methylobacter sp.]
TSLCSRQPLLRCSTSCIRAVVDSGNPCRNDGLPQTLVYNDERSSVGTQFQTLCVILQNNVCYCDA